MSEQTALTIREVSKIKQDLEKISIYGLPFEFQIARNIIKAERIIKHHEKLDKKIRDSFYRKDEKGDLIKFLADIIRDPETKQPTSIKPVKDNKGEYIVVENEKTLTEEQTYVNIVEDEKLDDFTKAIEKLAAVDYNTDESDYKVAWSKINEKEFNDEIRKRDEQNKTKESYANFDARLLVSLIDRIIIE